MLIVETTVASAEEAERLTGALLDRRLAACVQQGAVISTYRWQGEIERSDEVLLRIKAPASARAALVAAVEELHPYETPEIVIVEGTASDRYGAWVDAESEAAG